MSGRPLVEPPGRGPTQPLTSRLQVKGVEAYACARYPPGPRGPTYRKMVPAVPAFEIILRRPQVPDKILYRTRAETVVGDLVKIKGRHWLVVLKEPPFEQRRIERLVCVPRKVRNLH